MNERKIVPVVIKYNNFKEAEQAENNYWQNKSEVERLEALMDLRSTMFDQEKHISIEKVVYKKSVNEET